MTAQDTSVQSLDKLACQVVDAVKRGLPTAVLDCKQTELKTKDDLRIIQEECVKLGFEVPKLVRSEMVQIDLDYKLVVGWS